MAFGKLDAAPVFAPIRRHPGLIGASKKIEAYFIDATLQTEEYRQVRRQLLDTLLAGMDFALLETLADEARKERIRAACDAIIVRDIRAPLTGGQIELLKIQAIEELLGFGPIDALMHDPEVSDIMVNGHKQVYIERDGKILLTDVTFAGEKHLLSVIQKIVARVGRRIDEASPMVDARMADGSRFNAVIPPLALDGCLVSIRKFRKNRLWLADYVDLGSLSEPMYRFLSLCGAIRLNILISGGTGSGKTTLLGGLSGAIDHGERIVTIEDAAELQLQQPHVLRMETRPPNMEGAGEVTQRQLLRNALRMRPDRIIIGEIRGDEVIDVLSAMNTGHDGSMATIHANSPRDALARVEHLVGMAQPVHLPSLRHQIAGAIQLVIQVARQRDGRRRVVQIDEVAGAGEDGIVTRTLFGFRSGEMNENGVLGGQFYSTGILPHFISRAAYFGKEKELRACLESRSDSHLLPVFRFAPFPVIIDRGSPAAIRALTSIESREEA